jgi:hypothetical protein
VADRVKALAPQHPDWKDKEPFASMLKGDLRRALAAEQACSWSMRAIKKTANGLSIILLIRLP